MKKNSLLCILDLIDGHPVDTEGLKAEIEAELAKGKAKAEANRAVYADMHDKVIETIRMANAPVTAQEIADATKFARGKLVWGLTNIWTDEIGKDSSGKTTVYFLK